MLPFLWIFSVAADVVRIPSQKSLSDVDDRSYFFGLFLAGFACQCLLVLVAYAFRTNDLALARQLAMQRCLAEGKDVKNVSVAATRRLHASRPCACSRACVCVLLNMHECCVL
jgi:hypothetical protein